MLDSKLDTVWTWTMVNGWTGLVFLGKVRKSYFFQKSAKPVKQSNETSTHFKKKKRSMVHGPSMVYGPWLKDHNPSMDHGSVILHEPLPTHGQLIHTRVMAHPWSMDHSQRPGSIHGPWPMTMVF